MKRVPLYRFHCSQGHEEVRWRGQEGQDWCWMAEGLGLEPHRGERVAVESYEGAASVVAPPLRSGSSR